MSYQDEILEEEATPEQPNLRKPRVSPWKNKAEFEQVYNWLYGDDASTETKVKACKRMIIWKIRRLELTPATVLSTLVIVEVQLKDDPKRIEKQSDLRIMYSSAFTRFLNYMTSIMQTRHMRTMYQTAKELGLESFMVDLRHLCAHGQAIPSLEIFRKTSDYCLKWLKEFYWDHERKYMQNVDAKQIRQKERTVFDESVSELFFVYDAVMEAIFKGCVLVTEAKKVLNAQTYGILKKYSNNQEEKDLEKLSSMALKDLSKHVKREVGLKDVQQIYLSALLRTIFFFQVAAYHAKKYKVSVIISRYQPLFRAVAFFGFIEGLFHNLLAICENNYEVTYKRQGASFWANEIVRGFVVFRDFKLRYKEEKEKNPEFNLAVSTLNDFAMAKSIRKLYKEMGVDIHSTLIFGDTFRRPWSLSLSRSFIDERIDNINEFTANTVKSCLLLVVPSFKDEQIENVIKLIDIYCDQAKESFTNEEEFQKKNINWDNLQICSLSKDILGHDEAEMMDADGDEKVQTFGKWSTIPDGYDWHSSPLGRLPWE